MTQQQMLAGAIGLLVGTAVAVWGRRGSYRHAGEPSWIGWRWWLQVPLQAAAWALLARLGWWALPAIAYATIGGAAAFIDIEVRRLPDQVTAAAAAAVATGVMVAASATREWDRVLPAALAGAALFGVYLAIALIGTMGGGDIKLAGSTGIVLGAQSGATVVVGAYAGLLLGVITGVGWMVVRGRGRQSHIPLGPAIVSGALTALAIA